jgi:hypothetical protein
VFIRFWIVRVVVSEPGGRDNGNESIHSFLEVEREG